MISATPYQQRFEESLARFGLRVAADVVQLDDTTAKAALCYFLELACQSQHVANIEIGRDALASIPRPWLVPKLAAAVGLQLNLEDAWEFRRLLELYRRIDKGLLGDLITRGAKSDSEEIREAARDIGSTLRE